MSKYILVLLLTLSFVLPCVAQEEEALSINRTMEVPFNEPQLSSLTRVIGDTAHIMLYSELSIKDELFVYSEIQLLKNNPKVKNIEVFLNSPGGGAYAGFAIGDQFKRIKDIFNLSVHASGTVASAAVMIFAAFDQRYASEHTFFMVHEVSGGTTAGMDASEIKIMDTLFDKLTSLYIDVLCQNTNKSKENWEEMLKETTWFSAKEAEEWGLVTEIR
jgi:ATP-dependent Clp protease protease subunit